MNKDEDWATENLKMVPFWRAGMTPEEYDLEREHLFRNFEKYKKGEYVPLWKQKSK